MATSISSSFFEDQAAVENLVSAALTANPQIRWFDARRGSTACDVTPERWLATYRAVEDEFDEASPVTEATKWEVTAGTPGVVELTWRLLRRRRRSACLTGPADRRAGARGGGVRSRWW